MLSVGRRTAGVDHAKLRELLLVTSRTCNLLRFVNERIIAKSLADADYSSKVGKAHQTVLQAIRLRMTVVKRVCQY